MKITKELLIYMKENWKIFVHLLFRTRHFGVNNEWWYSDNAYMGLPLHKIVWRIVMVLPIIREYYCIRFRAIHNKFIPIEETDLLDWDQKNSPGYFTVIAMNNPLFMLKWLTKRLIKKLGWYDYFDKEK